MALVFLQQGYSGELPRLTYLTFIDEIYIIAYAPTLGVFGIMLWGSRRYYQALQLESDVGRREALKRLRAFDDVWPAALILLALLMAAVSWFTT